MRRNERGEREVGKKIEEREEKKGKREKSG